LGEKISILVENRGFFRHYGCDIIYIESEKEPMSIYHGHLKQSKTRHEKVGLDLNKMAASLRAGKHRTPGGPRKESEHRVGGTLAGRGAVDEYWPYVDKRVGDFIGHSIEFKDTFWIMIPFWDAELQKSSFRKVRMRRTAGAWRWSGARWQLVLAGPKGGWGSDTIGLVETEYELEPDPVIQRKIYDEATVRLRAYYKHVHECNISKDMED